MKFVRVISSEPARTGEILNKCKECKNAALIEGDEIEGKSILFCLLF
jgi:hypothetical protein